MQHLVIGRTGGGVLDLLFDYDRDRQTLRWWRMTAQPTLAEQKGTIALPAELVEDAERLARSAAGEVVAERPGDSV